MTNGNAVGETAYRWVIVAAAAAMLAISMGLLVNGLSVFFIPLEQEFGWTRGSIALINTFGLVGLAAGGIAMGGLADRTNIRYVCLFGAVVVGVCVLAASRANALWQLYVLFFLAGAFGGGSLFAPLIALVGNWFRAGAGLAIGIASAGQAVGQGGVPFGSAYLINAFGWRGAMLGLGAISLATLVPLALLTREPPVRAATGAAASSDAGDDGAPLPTPVIVAWLSAAVLGCCTCMSVPLMHLVPLIEGRGISAPEAGSVLFVMLLVAILGRVAFGRFADMVGAIPAYMTASLWQTLLVFGFTQINDLSSFYIFAPIYGFGYAGVMTGVLITIRSLTPASRRGISTGIILAFAWLGHGLGGYQGGLFFDITGGYTVSFANAALAGVINLVLAGTLFVTVRRRTPVAAWH
ncbi:MFS transporter [Oricola nitratireducens]|uniref:MFS transporter n=1 Tax=Oricola nitratireducens TaxID=2775868 RepID=UPI00186744B9|nr:MFS transporter [Oricola nitratireducens]